MIYINGNKANLYDVVDLIDAEAEKKGYDPDEVFEMFWNFARHGREDFKDQLCSDFGIEVVA